MKKTIILIAITLGVMACKKETTTPAQTTPADEITLYKKWILNDSVTILPIAGTSQSLQWIRSNETNVFNYVGTTITDEYFTFWNIDEGYTYDYYYRVTKDTLYYEFKRELWSPTEYGFWLAY